MVFARGAMDPGESAAEYCAHEVLEEAGLVVAVGRFNRVYSIPHRVIEYRDGNRKQAFDLVFGAAWVSEEVRFSDELTEADFFSRDEMDSMDLMELFYERVDDELASRDAALVR